MAATISFTIIKGIPNYTYELFNVLNEVVQSGTTSTIGSYFFYGVENGSYYIKVTDGFGNVYNQPVIVNCV